MKGSKEIHRPSEELRWGGRKGESEGAQGMGSKREVGARGGCIFCLVMMKRDVACI